MPTIGHIGRYALKYKIGAGGLGTVYAAHDPLLSRLIAIKTLNLEISAEERDAFNSLFLNEARAAGGLSHPHIVTVFDAGVSDQSAYIAMELLKGRDLRQLRQEGWRPSPAQAALIVRRVGDALAYAHSKGVVHRDIKPANIFMVGRTQPRVLDFGIARVAHQRDSAVGDIAAGSPYYMAPEQARQQTVDRRADVFSLGVVLYELLTDQKPFQGSTLAEITTAVLEHHPSPANEVNPRVPAALAEIAARAMEKDPEHRYRSARALSRELRHWLDENANAPDTEPADDAAAQPPRRKSRLLAAAAVTVVVGSTLAWWAASGSHAPPEAAAAVTPAAAVRTAARPASAAATLVAPGGAATVATDAAPAAAGPSTAALATPDLPAAPTAGATTPVPTETLAPPKVAAVVVPKEALKARPPKPVREIRPAPAAPAAPAAMGSVRIAVSPWGNVEVDGTPVGTTPPLNELTLSEGKHQITLRNADFPPLSVSVTVTPGQPVSVKHKFGS